MFLTRRYYYFTYTKKREEIKLSETFMAFIYDKYHEIFFVNEEKEIMVLDNLSIAETIIEDSLTFIPNTSSDSLIDSDFRIMQRFHHTWYNTLYDYLSSKKFLNILIQIAKERKTGVVYPEMDKQLLVFKMPINYVNVVLLGLDPYTTGEANGFAFPSDRKIKPKSLSNLEQGMFSDLKLSKEEYFLRNDLSHLVKQGVFLLNCSLTVKKGFVKGHLELWKDLIKLVLQTLNDVRDKRLIFIFLGSDAQKNTKYITSHISLSCEHPAKCVYEEREFYHNNIFSETNMYMLENKNKEIKWMEKLS